MVKIERYGKRPPNFFKPLLKLQYWLKIHQWTPLLWAKVVVLKVDGTQNRKKMA